VSIVEITKPQFDALNVGEHRELWANMQECGWFQDRPSRVVATLYFDPGTNLYGYSVCIRTEAGYRRVASGADIPREGLARKDVLNAMHGV
jgi:hypothetical protein